MKSTKRKADIAEKIDAYLQDETAEPLKLLLYKREVRQFQTIYPQVEITMGDHLNNTDLIICSIKRIEDK